MFIFFITLAIVFWGLSSEWLIKHPLLNQRILSAQKFIIVLH